MAALPGRWRFLRLLAAVRAGAGAVFRLLVVLSPAGPHSDPSARCRSPLGGHEDHYGDRPTKQSSLPPASGLLPAQITPTLPARRRLRFHRRGQPSRRSTERAAPPSCPRPAPAAPLAGQCQSAGKKLTLLPDFSTTQRQVCVDSEPDVFRFESWVDSN